MQTGKALIIYTGGTIGMVQDPVSGALKPFDLNLIIDSVPELQKFNFSISAIAFQDPIDSSNMLPEIWVKLAALIEEQYNTYDGFVILHGSDTMAYTASALSFLIENLSKPIILTGSQLPIGEVRTDARENLITALEIAMDWRNGQPTVPEVAIYFDYFLLRGNRTRKHNSEKFEAFSSPNYPPLAEAAISIKYNAAYIGRMPSKPLKVYKKMAGNIAVLKLFPGITQSYIEALLHCNALKALILEGYGAGNAPDYPWFLNILKQFIDKGLIVIVITQCQGGSVELGKYTTSSALKAMGIIEGLDLTFEACVTKLMFLIAQDFSNAEIGQLMTTDLRGELTQ